MTTKLDHTAITVNGQAAGLVLYGRQNPNHFAKATLQFKNDVDPNTPGNQPGKWIERTLTTNNNLDSSYGGSFPNSGALTPPTNDLWIRARYDGTNVITEYSYDGVAFNTQAPPVPATAYGPNGVTKIGLFVKHDGSGPATNVKFDSFRVDAESCEEQADATPPRTTHELDPAEPDGDNGWYTSPVEVTLNATDNDGGSASTPPSTASRATRSGRRTRRRSPSTTRAGTRSSTGRPTTRATPSRSSRCPSGSTRPIPTTTRLLNGEAPEESTTARSRST